MAVSLRQVLDPLPRNLFFNSTARRDRDQLQNLQ
jgi:hypothetical protein